MNLSSNQTVNTRLLGYDPQTSLLGTVIPIVYGVQRLSGNVIWVGNWTTKTGGKGLKTKASSTDVDYQCALIIGLCQGPIYGVQNVWSNKDEYNLVKAIEGYTVPGGGGTHNSNQLSQYVFTSVGVFRDDTVTVTYADPGDPNGTVTKTVAVQTPMTLVDSAPGKGQYTYGLQPSGGHAQWTFSAADGATSAVMTITYNYVISSNGKPVSTLGNPLTRLILAIYNGQQGQDPWGWLEQNAPEGQVLGYSELAYAACPLMDLGTSGTIPSYNFEIAGRCGFNLIVGGAIQDCLPTDIINDMLTNPLDGVLGWVSSTGDASGEGLASFSGICTVDGVDVTGLSGSDFTLLTAGASFCINGVQLFVDTIAGAKSLTLTTDAGQQPDGVGWVAVVVEPYSTLFGISSYLPVAGSSQGLLAYGGTCNTSGTAVTSLGNTGELRSLFNAGMVGSKVSIVGALYPVVAYTDQFHITIAPNTATGQLPGSLTGAVWSAGSEVARYCAANGIFLSLVMDTAQDARQWINDLMEAANADCFWSEGVLKFRSYGDTSAYGNGYIYTPDTAPIYDLTDAELICDPGQAPITLKRKDIRDAENEVSLEWTNRAAGYALNTVTEQDFAAVTAYGRRPAATKTMHSICQQEVAELVAVTSVRRSVYIDGGNQYEFTLPPHFCLLDPMDIVTLTDAYLGLDKLPVRIISIEEDESLRLKITAEEFPWSCSAPTLYPKQGHTPTQPGFFTDPGPINTPMFVHVPAEMVQGNEQTLGIAASGSQNWGGCDVYMATAEDGPYDTYVGHLSGPSTMGLTTAALPVGADPDAVHTLSVDLTESYGALASYTQDQADALDLLVAVEQELISYEYANFLGTHLYQLTGAAGVGAYLRRGVYGSGIAAHATGKPFCVLDSGILHWKYPASVIGQTVWFKFCSVNLVGGQKQDLSTVTAFPCLIQAPPPAPSFGVGQSTLDPTVAEVYDVSFVTGGVTVNPNTFSVATGTIRFYYVDEAADDYLLADALGTTDTSMTLVTPGGGKTPVSALAGLYAQIGEEIVLCGTPVGDVVPITRAQLGSVVASAGPSDSVLPVLLQTVTVTFPAGFFTGADASNWVYAEALPNMKLISVTMYATNANGESPLGMNCLTGNADFGLRLVAPAPGATVFTTIFPPEDEDFIIPSGNVLAYVKAIHNSVAATLPPESADVGNTVMVKLSADSTYDCIISPYTGDDIDGSPVPYTVTPAAPIWSGIANPGS